MRKARNPTTLRQPRTTRPFYFEAPEAPSADPDDLFLTVAAHATTLAHLSDLASLLIDEVSPGDDSLAGIYARNHAVSVTIAVNIVATVLRADVDALGRLCSQLKPRPPRHAAGANKDEPNGADR